MWVKSRKSKNAVCFSRPLFQLFVCPVCCLDAGRRKRPCPVALLPGQPPCYWADSKGKQDQQDRATETERQKANYFGSLPPGRAIQLSWNNKVEYINHRTFVLFPKRSMFVSMMLIPCKEKMVGTASFQLKASKNANGPGLEPHWWARARTACLCSFWPWKISFDPRKNF